jgi:hypothetical protein
MDFFRSTKKESEQNDAPPAAGSDKPSPPADLLAVAERLGSLGHLLGEINEQLMVHLLRREAAESSSTRPASCSEASTAAVQSGLQDIKEKLQAMEQKCEAIDHRENELAQGLQNVHVAIDTRLREIDARVQETLAARFAELLHLLRPPAPQTDRKLNLSADLAAWQRAILGPELAADPSIDRARDELCSQVIEGDPAACAMVGQLLVFQGSPPEKMPQLLKDIGEAYYRWQPKSHAGHTPMEAALVRWLVARCDAAGVPNTIELVNPAERFDVMRHNAATRGVEITAVHGWIVLRDSGKVYTKATVTVR